LSVKACYSRMESTYKSWCVKLPDEGELCCYEAKQLYLACAPASNGIGLGNYLLGVHRLTGGNAN